MITRVSMFISVRIVLTIILAGYLADVSAEGFIRPDAPAVPLAPYNGERYTALVPDTLDIGEHARLAVRGLTGPLDPDDDYSLYWLVNFQNKPDDGRRRTSRGRTWPRGPWTTKLIIYGSSAHIHVPLWAPLIN